MVKNKVFLNAWSITEKPRYLHPVA